MRKRRVIKILAWILGILGALLLALVIWYRLSINIQPPEPDGTRSYDFSRVHTGDSTYTSDHGWLRHAREGIWELYVEGDAFTRGYTTGLLTEELIVKQEVAFIKEIRRRIPSDSYLKTLRYFITIFNRKLPHYIPLEYQREIAGISNFVSEEYDFIGAPYLRILNYHAAHDIGHALQNMNLVACTAFGAWGAASADSNIVIGRNFDFYVGDEFSREKIIMFVKPDTGHAFMSIAWGGFIGVVSGMNEKGLTVTLNAAKSTIPLSARTPVSILAREILQYASSIEEALEIARQFDTFVSESFLIGSAEDTKVALIEKTPDSTVLFQPGAQMIVVTNHFQSATYQDDELNIENMANGTSVYRYQRTQQLLEENTPLDVEKAAEILRDYRGLDNKDIGLGNEKAVNQFIAHHSIIFKPQELKVWVAAPPYQLGEYLCYDLGKIFEVGMERDLHGPLNLPGESIAEDSVLYGPVYPQLMKYKAMSRSLEHGEATPQQADSLIGCNPEFFLAYRIVGDYYQDLGQTGKARRYYRAALEKEPPSEAERSYVLERLEE